ncbi:glycosyltransferase family 4 protein [Microbacter margulisiae]|uniref:Mannosyltransferase n=1 Tax=Microbacter margulisiae TaxID=1350067 RepID=A0A7W5H2A0_9PORP|nr:glycosyltransferase family 1 protein [Microbacter margulisiae]MBB3187176.1 mannosyltransferase [Microbacter margulisiae]
MKIYLDNIIFSIQKAGGISIRWKELLSSISRSELQQAVYYIQYKNSSANIYDQEIKRMMPSDHMIQRKHYYFSRLFSLHLPEQEDKFIFYSSYYRVSSNRNAINVLTFHDCIQEFYMKGLQNKVAIFMKRRAVKKADHIICNSYTTKRDLMAVYNYPEQQISVIYSGVSPCFFPMDSTIRPNSLLFVGSRAAYKRFDFVIALLKHNPGWRLTVVGGGDFSKRELALMTEVRNRVEHLQGITESRLNELYNAATCLIHPSQYEGFGVPVVEAMRAGCPVVAFACPAVKEIAGEGALLFDRYDVHVCSQLIDSLQNVEIRKKLQKKAFIVAQKYSWEKVGCETVQLLQNI